MLAGIVIIKFNKNVYINVGMFYRELKKLVEENIMLKKMIGAMVCLEYFCGLIIS